jgi:hypothetical protein
MAMSFIEEFACMRRARFVTAFILSAAAIGLSACAQSEIRISPDFGDAVRADMAAQIADPDAHYTGTPAPGASDGARIGLAQTRYEKNQVIQPSSTTASSAASIGNADNGNSTGAGVGMSGAGAGASTGP